MPEPVELNKLVASKYFRRGGLAITGYPKRGFDRLKLELGSSVELRTAPFAADKNFQTYVTRMLRVVHENGFEYFEFQGNGPLKQAVVTHIITEYQEMRELGVAPTTIRDYGHTTGLNGARRIFEETRKEFEADAESRQLIKTAANAVMKKKYPDAKAAKKEYDAVLEEAKRVFDEKGDKPTVTRTVAIKVFTDYYKSVQEAKIKHDQYLRKVANAFEGVEAIIRGDTGRIVRTGAYLLLNGQCKTPEEFKSMFEKTLADAKTRHPTLSEERQVETALNRLLRED